MSLPKSSSLIFKKMNNYDLGKLDNNIGFNESDLSGTL